MFWEVYIMEENEEVKNEEVMENNGEVTFEFKTVI